MIIDNITRGFGDMEKAVYDDNNDGIVNEADYAEYAGHATNADTATEASSAQNAAMLDNHSSSYYAEAAYVSDLSQYTFSLNGIIAVSENAVSSRAYTYDASNPQFLVWPSNGVAHLGEVIANIAIGDTITPGTNVLEIDNVMDFIVQHSGQGGGHVIENGAGTDMTQRANLQFAGYQTVTDDSVGNRTIIDDSPINITWEAYSALTDAQRAGKKYLVSGAPSPSPSPADAEHVSYDNTDSGLDATNVQDAIDEVLYSMPYTGVWLGPYTLAAGISTYTITDQSIAINSAIDVYYTNADKSVVGDVGETWTQTNGSVTVTFGSALPSSVTIEWVHVTTIIL